MSSDKQRVRRSYARRKLGAEARRHELLADGAVAVEDEPDALISVVLAAVQ